jgi:hypothetical protein
MSQEIREMINKIKSINKFLNENIKTIDDFYNENDINPDDLSYLGSGDFGKP